METKLTFKKMPDYSLAEQSSYMPPSGDKMQLKVPRKTFAVQDGEKLVGYVVCESYFNTYHAFNAEKVMIVGMDGTPRAYRERKQAAQSLVA